MRKFFFHSFIFMILLAGCTSPSGETSTALTPTNLAIITNTQIPSTHTPLPPTPSPSPTLSPTPIPLDFNKQNFSRFTGVQSYGSVLAKYFKKESYDVLTYAMDYSTDGSTIAIGGCLVSCSTTLGGRVFLLMLDPSMVEPILEIPIETESQIWDVDLNPNASVLIYSVRGKVLRYDRATKILSDVNAPINNTQVPFNAISPDGKLLSIVTESSLLVHNLVDGSQVALLNGTFWGQNAPFFNALGNRFLVYSQQTDRDAIVYDTASWMEVARFPVAGTGKAALSSDGTLLAVLSKEESAVTLYDITTGTKKDMPITPYIEVTSLIFNPADDLLLTFGDPGQNVDLFEGVQVIDLQNAKVVGSLTQFSNPGFIKFSADGTTFLRLSYTATDIALWSLPNADTLKIESLVDEYFNAISIEDYQSAAAMTQLDSYARDEVVTYGLNPDDLPTVFATLCAVDEVPCLPLGRIVRVMADFDRGWDYYAIVTLQKPDGSEIMFDDITLYELLGIIRLEDGSFKISTLHPGMRYPYQE